MTDHTPSAADVALMLARTGLSQTDAAGWLGVHTRTVSRWIAGDLYPSGQPMAPAPSHWARLRELLGRQRDAADQAIALIDEQRRQEAFDSVRQRRAAAAPDTVRLVVAMDDDAAAARGWPSRGAHLAMLRRVTDWCDDEGIPVESVFSGSSEAAEYPPPVQP